MLQDIDFDEMTSLIVGVYQDMELELLIEVAKRFDTYKTIGGTLEWYLSMLQQMNALDNEAIKIIAKHSHRSEMYIRQMLKKAQLANFNPKEIQLAYEMGFSKVTYEQLIQSSLIKNIFDNSYKEINTSLRLIQTKALESSKQSYMDILNRAYIEVSTGTYSFDQAIRKGIKAMAKKGITGVTYKRKDGSIMNYSVEAAVRRDTLSAAHKIANETTMQSVQMMGAEYVDVSSHIGARVNDKNPIANHAGWQGKQYKINGSEEGYLNFTEATGYGDIQGFGGVNCRHRMFAFFPGISQPYAVQYDEKTNREYYENAQKLRGLERQLRGLKKQKECLEQIAVNDNEVVKLNQKIKEKSKEIDAFCDKKGLRRDYTREAV